MVSRVLWFLAEQLGLQREDVVEHTVDTQPFEPVVGDDARMLELQPQRRSELAVDAQLAPHLSFLEELEAPVEGELLRAVRPDVHSVPSTSTLPASVTRTCTVLSAGSE